MKDMIRFLEDADRYLDGMMPAGERARFEEYCRVDEEAARMLEEQADIREALETHQADTRMRAALDQAYVGWKNAQPPAGTAQGDLSAERPEAPLVPLKRFYFKIAAIAASIALVIALGGIWISRSYSTHKLGSYTLLRREIDNIKRSQNSLIHDMHKPQNPAPADPGQFGGTGFAIASSGLIATNAHVIAGADSIYVETSKGESLKVSVLYQDVQADLAILQITDSAFGMPQLPYTLRKAAVPLGDEVYTLGYPRDEVVYGKGYISSETGYRGDSSSYQIAIPVNPGNSGGPLIDGNGQVLGIITGKQSPSDDIAFAVKASYLASMLDSVGEPGAKKVLQMRDGGLGKLSRVNQIKKLEPFIFLVKVYN